MGAAILDYGKFMAAILAMKMSRSIQSTRCEACEFSVCI